MYDVMVCGANKFPNNTKYPHKFGTLYRFQENSSPSFVEVCRLSSKYHGIGRKMEGKTKNGFQMGARKSPKPARAISKISTVEQTPYGSALRLRMLVYAFSYAYACRIYRMYRTSSSQYSTSKRSYGLTVLR